MPLKLQHHLMMPDVRQVTFYIRPCTTVNAWLIPHKLSTLKSAKISLSNNETCIVQNMPQNLQQW